MAANEIGDLKQVIEVAIKNTSNNKNLLSTLIDELSLIRLPSPYWKVDVDAKRTVIAFSIETVESNSVKIRKSVVVSETEKHTFKIDVFMDGVCVEIPYTTKTVSCSQELTYFLKTIDIVQFCKYYFTNSSDKKKMCSIFSLPFTDVCSYCLDQFYKANIKTSNNTENWVQSQSTLKSTRNTLHDITQLNTEDGIKCILCFDIFKTKKCLGHGNNLRQNANGLFECTICLKEYNNVADLTKHYKECHSAVKFIECTMCNRKYNDFRLLRKHIRIHQRLARFACYYCDQHFSSKLGLKNHSRVCLYKRNTTKVYSCSTCKTKFTTESLLRQHQREHQTQVSLKCKECIRSFDSQEQALAHKAKCKSRSMKYTCGICERKFSCISQKNCHMREIHMPVSIWGVSYL